MSKSLRRELAVSSSRNKKSQTTKVDPKWTELAINYLCKRIRTEKKDQLMDVILNLKETLESQSKNSPCVAIKRSRDGRIQIGRRKALPHVTYCRIWRWPDLKDHYELHPEPDCQYPFNNRRLKLVCVNPYHYKRITSGLMPDYYTGYYDKVASAEARQQQNMNSVVVQRVDNIGQQVMDVVDPDLPTTYSNVSLNEISTLESYLVNAVENFNNMFDVNSMVNLQLEK